MSRSALLEQDITEAQWQRQVISLAQTLGFRVAHFRTAMNARGRYMTPVAADGAGFPDLLLVRERVIVAELKTRTGKTSAAQDAWLEAFQAAGIEAFVWRPADTDEILATLRRKDTA